MHMQDARTSIAFRIGKKQILVDAITSLRARLETLSK